MTTIATVLTTETVTFDASDLWSRFGFGDGDVISMIEGSGISLTNAQYDALMWYDPIENIVRRYLVPEVERVTGKTCPVEFINTHHNTMRHIAHGECDMPEIFNEISVVLTLEQILECAKCPE